MKKNTDKNESVLNLAMGGMMAALVFIATFLLKVPATPQGYIHLGDGFILLGAALLGWTAVPAAAIGSMLADLLAGYTVYCLPTFVIKAGTAAVAVLATEKDKPLWLRLTLLVLAECVMVGGYFLAEWLFLGYGLPAAVAALIPNAIQGLSGVVIGGVLIPLFRKAKLPGMRR